MYKLKAVDEMSNEYGKRKAEDDGVSGRDMVELMVELLLGTMLQGRSNISGRRLVELVDMELGRMHLRRLEILKVPSRIWILKHSRLLLK